LAHATNKIFMLFGNLPLGRACPDFFGRRI
jgi:hypothetical protein